MLLSSKQRLLFSKFLVRFNLIVPTSPNMKGFLCFNCKPRMPKLGNNKWEIIMTILTSLLLILSVIEIVAFISYSVVFYSGTAEACCGLIEENSYPLPGAMCFESNITQYGLNQYIEQNSILCSINGTICDEYNMEDKGTSCTSSDLNNNIKICINSICTYYHKQRQQLVIGDLFRIRKFQYK